MNFDKKSVKNSLQKWIRENANTARETATAARIRAEIAKAIVNQLRNTNANTSLNRRQSLNNNNRPRPPPPNSNRGPNLNRIL